MCLWLAVTSDCISEWPSKLMHTLMSYGVADWVNDEMSVTLSEFVTNLVNVSLSLSLFLLLPLWNIGHPWNASIHSSFLILKTVGRTPWKGDQPVARPLPTHDLTNRINADKHPCLEWDSNPRFQCSNERRQFMRFEVFTAATMKNAVFRDVAPCSCLRPRGHCDRQTCLWVAVNTSERFNLISRGLIILKITCYSVSLELVFARVFL
jgi:hypothetical protein